MSAGTMYPLSLSDLKSLTPSANPNDRYYLTDQGKEGEFFLAGTYTSTPPITADDAIYINSNVISGNIYQYQRLIVDGLIDVRWFGALGDGTDQTTALQAALTTPHGNTILFGVPGGGEFKINTVTVTVPGGKVLKFLEGNYLSGSATINGGIIDAGYRQQIFATGFAVSPAGCMDNLVSAQWFGAGLGVADSQPAIQNVVDMVIANSALPKTIFFPRGNYQIDNPILIANYDAAENKYNQATVLLKGEEPGTNRFSGLGATITTNFKDRFAIGFQLCKSGGVESLHIVGQYSVPSMASDTFFNNNPFSSYGDPTCRDSRYSPYSGVVIDPFCYGFVPADGGYPGMSDYYTRATGQYGSQSGSSGLYFKDLFVSNFTVCICESPNASTRNCEALIYEDIQVADCKLGFSASQDQEKNNGYKNIICWGTAHTLFSDVDYGADGPGNSLIDTVNIAGAVCRFINWGVGGTFPSYFRNIYAESLGSFGVLNSALLACTVENSLFDFVSVLEEFGNYYPDFHVSASAAVTFKSCIFRMYGSGLPVLLAGSGMYEYCTFEVPPVTRVEEGASSNDTVQFRTCRLSIINGTIGSDELLQGSINQFGGYSLLGNWSLTDANGLPQNVYGQYFVSHPFLRRVINLAASPTITITGSKRSFTFTTPYSDFLFVGDPIIVSPGATNLFGGLITAIDPLTNTVTVSYAQAAVTSGTYSVFPYLFLRPFRILGDLTFNDPHVTNSVSGGFDGAVGDLVFLPEMGGYNRIIATSSGTYTFAGGARISRTGATLAAPGMQFRMNSLSIGAPASGTVPGTTVFKKGDVLVDSYTGTLQEYICIADGMFNPTDGRIAYFTLNGAIQNTLTATGSFIVPAGYLVEGFVLNADAAQSGITIGTTSGGTDIASSVSLTTGVSKVITWNAFTDADKTIYFGGISGPVTIDIKTMVKTV